MINTTLMHISLSVKITDKELTELLVKALKICTAKQQGFFVSISDFDFDPRELWEIPEAIAFMQKLIDSGFISALEVSSSCHEMMSKHGKKLANEFGSSKIGLGALEVWLCAKNKINKNLNTVTNDIMVAFLYDLKHKSNPKSYDLMRKSLTPAKIKDAPVRHKSH